MNGPSDLATIVSERFRSRLLSGFPTKDINTLFSEDEDAHDLFHFRIEMFLSGIAGYASRAARMHREPEEMLREARRFLSQSFFERYPEFDRYQELITPNATPGLFQEMEEAEENRQDMLKVVEDLLMRPGPMG